MWFINLNERKTNLSKKLIHNLRKSVLQKQDYLRHYKKLWFCDVLSRLRSRCQNSHEQLGCLTHETLGVCLNRLRNTS